MLSALKNMGLLLNICERLGVGFEILTAVTMTLIVWNITP
jgi:hypothetical protein